ncbi:DivIVA domain-containing protein [Enterococcus hulanensis]|uniref:DivIVA domain-containing protein n=1 Tax=Enterococcus hulanensis TaxID=2559929 RepID=A0ABU3F0M8_9ENTE|nr:DivIVA domain-containing protein [Enterococcus hulanensis]MDT2600063.1 DivIVA domain-containing protein [Enterococcus hulanensis]MDT2612024.1 DivIVA domain-containing protein [Enterococcus hulanensis]MDT2619173.1 DivIVA domain-containing protein [Enterococcus hulanensis]MDT2630738.1 DivIVA domain-containing protein [Enterococcus hulanensis]MDT2658137.1 DivIVA domain-containing protein [Enterococcus hulanensis]
MHFKPLDIRGLTFRRRLFGYRAGDVKDFMKHVVEDYEAYQVKESEIVVYQHELEEKQGLIEEREGTIHQLNEKYEQLMGENERLKEFELEIQELEKMKELAQRTADTVQAEAKQLMEQAEQKSARLLQEAESTKMNHLLNIQIELGELMSEQEHLNTQIANKKMEYFELELQCEDMLANKERVAKEAQVLKQEFLTLRSKLIQKYADGLDEFIEENQLLNQPTNEEQPNNVMKLTSKRIG